ncbi:MAG: rod shape-determining protein MreD [Acidimicrobiales bacterium]
MTLRAWRRLFVVGLVFVVVQVGVLGQIDLGGAHPDVFLLVAICAGLVAGPQVGAVVGFVTGLVADVFVVTPFGLSALCYVLVAFAVGLAASLQGGRAPFSFQVATGFVASIGGTLLYEILAALIGQPHLPRSELTSVVIVVSVANGLLAVPASMALRWVFAGAGSSGRELASARGAFR